MKNTEQHEHAATGRTRNGNSVSAGFYSNFIFNWQSVAGNRDRLAPEAMLVVVHRTGGDRLQTQNLAKAPPGRTRSPGAPRGHPPEGRTGPPEPDVGLPTEKNNTKEGFPPNRTEVKSEKEGMNNNNKKMKHYKHLNFSTMKKQILFLVVFVLAAFAGVKSYGQDPNYITPVAPATVPDCVNPTPLGVCASDDALHPIPGKTYTYTIGVAPNVTTGNVQWFVYNATAHGASIISSGNIATATGNAEPNGGTSLYLLNATPAAYNQATGNTSPTIDVSWQSFDGATTQILLVAYVKGENGCSDNIEAWRIQPIFAFTLDIAGLMPDGTINSSGNANECVSPVQSASYDGANLTMDYGENYIFFTVNAANFVHSWMPTFSVEDNTTSTPVAVSDITWAYPDQAVSATGTWNSAATAVDAKDASGAVGAAGECIVVRVHLDHANHENDVAGHVTIGVNGKMYDVAASSGNEYSNVNLQDLDPGATSPCSNTVTDEATYDLNPRPNITPVSPVDPFVPKN